MFSQCSLYPIYSTKTVSKQTETNPKSPFISSVSYIFFVLLAARRGYYPRAYISPLIAPESPPNITKEHQATTQNCFLTTRIQFYILRIFENI